MDFAVLAIGSLNLICWFGMFAVAKYAVRPLMAASVK